MRLRSSRGGCRDPAAGGRRREHGARRRRRGLEEDPGQLHGQRGNVQGASTSATRTTSAWISFWATTASGRVTSRGRACSGRPPLRSEHGQVVCRPSWSSSPARSRGAGPGASPSSARTGSTSTRSRRVESEHGHRPGLRDGRPRRRHRFDPSAQHRPAVPSRRLGAVQGQGPPLTLPRGPGGPERHGASAPGPPALLSSAWRLPGG